MIKEEIEKNRIVNKQTDGRTPDPFYKVIAERWPKKLQWKPSLPTTTLAFFFGSWNRNPDWIVVSSVITNNSSLKNSPQTLKYDEKLSRRYIIVCEILWNCRSKSIFLSVDNRLVEPQPNWNCRMHFCRVGRQPTNILAEHIWWCGYLQRLLWLYLMAFVHCYYP